MKAAREPDADGIALPIGIWIGGKRRSVIGRLQLLGVLLLLAAVASIPLTVGVGTWLDHRATIKEWTAAGSPCPRVAEISIAARGAKPPPPFTFLGAHFAYQIGDVECAAVPEKNLFDSSSYTVCQFDAAGAVEVGYAGRTTIFEPGVGHGAMVTIRKGALSCTVTGAGRFHGPEIGRKLEAARNAAPR